ncbi:MAG: hypothetical protein HY298_03550 [Verrucomicrobia bacterium]|nr:hypothetical protein [Verrucomicrobiota bacterium]
MKTNVFKITRAGLLVGALFTAATAFALGEYDNNLKKSFPASPGGKLVVDADRGAIDVTTGETDKVEVQVFRKLRGLSQSRADEIFKAHEMTFEQQADLVTVSAKFQGATGGLFNRGGSGLQVRYQISIPKKFNVDLKTAGGGITQADLTGTVRAQTSGGSLKLARIDGPVWGKTSGGSISLTSASGEVEVRTSGGSIQIGEVGDNVFARTSGGSVRLDKAKGAVVAETSGGNIEIGEAEGSAEAKTSGGNISIKKSHGKVTAKTSGGNIEAGEVHGDVVAKTTGGSVSVHLTGQPKADCHLETSGGSIRLDCAENVAVDLDAKTSGGRVVTELPVTVAGEHKSSELHGKINGGGPVVCLRTSGGSIHLKKKVKRIGDGLWRTGKVSLLRRQNCNGRLI